MRQEITLLDRLEAEHKELMQGAQNLEQLTNDLEAIRDLNKASEDFIPWRVEQSKQIMRDLQRALEVIDNKLSAHFDHEERDLLTLCQNHTEDDMFGSVLLNFVIEHGEIKSRIAKLKLDLANLANSKLSPYIWEGRAHPMRFYLNHTRRRLQAHAESEQELLNALRRELEGD